MAINLDKGFETTKNDGVATLTYNDEKAYMENSEVSKEDTIKVFKHSGEFIAGATEAAAAEATVMFNDDKELDKVNAEFKYGPTGSGRINVAINREKTFRVPGTDNSVTRPDIQTKVKHVDMGMGKTAIKNLQDKMKDAIANV